jgi:hypothetical protein
MSIIADFWAELFDHLWGKVLLFALTSVASFLLGRWIGGYLARRNWEKRHLFDRLNVSLNSFHDGGLQIRTLLERSLDEVFHNPAVVSRVRNAAQRTTADNPFLPVDVKESWFWLNFVVNVVSEHFSVGAIRRDAGQPVKVMRYALFLTSEVVEAGRLRKVRAMLIRPELLREFPYPDSMPRLEQTWHQVRVQTLRKAAALYKSSPEQFLEVELCV